MNEVYDQITEEFLKQVKKYRLEEEVIGIIADRNSWIKTINEKQINNFNSLTISPQEIPFPKPLLLNRNLLNCNDYLKRVEAMSKIKDWNFPSHLLCEPSFLNSKTYYEDMEMISRMSNIQSICLALTNEDFINSPYHKEDLEKMIRVSNDSTKTEEEKEELLDALKYVMINKNSIQSPYHREDIEIIMNAKPSSIQYTNSFPEYGLNHLAINEESLKDKHHVENMKILSEDPLCRKQLFRIMTDEEHINGNNYLEEIAYLQKANSKLKGIAIYYYINNLSPSADNYFLYRNSKESVRHDFLEDLKWDTDNDMDYYTKCKLIECNSIYGRESKNYLRNLELLNKIDDKYVLYVSALLSNKDFDKSAFQEEDINMLCSITDKKILLDAFLLMSNPVFLSSTHHLKDLKKVIQTEEEFNRRLLCTKVINEESIKSPYHDWDMDYIMNLKIDYLDENNFERIQYYLFDSNGINHPKHMENLERLKVGEEEIIDTNHLYETIKNNLSYEEPTKEKVFTKLRNLFRNKFHKN